MPSKEILEVSAYLIETRVAFVRSEKKIKQISKIIHYSLKNQAFQSYYSHSCFRGRLFAHSILMPDQFVASTIYHVSLFIYLAEAHGRVTSQ